MSVVELLTEAAVRPARELVNLKAGSWPTSHFTYLLWDMAPEPGWLPADHALSDWSSERHFRPLYLGKAASWGSVHRHLSKEGFGDSSTTPTDKNLINEGLVAYCMRKRTHGWLGLSILTHETGANAQALEKKGVAQLGWRRDIKTNRCFSKGQIAEAKQAGANAWRRALEALVSHHGSAVSAAIPLTEGLLFNRTDPASDVRGATLERSPRPCVR